MRVPPSGLYSLSFHFLIVLGAFFILESLHIWQELHPAILIAVRLDTIDNEALLTMDNPFSQVVLQEMGVVLRVFVLYQKGYGTNCQTTA